MPRLIITKIDTLTAVNGRGNTEVIIKREQGTGKREQARGNREIPIIKIRGFVQGRIETSWLTPSRFKYFYLF
jgi:hypothetical protein